jgi:hypothetical protein
LNCTRQKYAQEAHFLEFLKLHREGAIGTLYAVETGAREQLDWNLDYEAKRKDLSAGLQMQAEIMSSNHELLAKVSPMERVAFIKSHSELFVMEDLYSEMLALDNEMHQRAEENVHTLELINKTAPVENEFAALEQEVNQIFLRTTAVHRFEISEEDKMQLEAIAEKCPSLYGDAVTKARTLSRFLKLVLLQGGVTNVLE